MTDHAVRMMKTRIEAPASGKICDFCSATPIYAEFDCRNFTQGLTVSEGAWDVCRGCAVLIQQESWNGLVERLIGVLTTGFPMCCQMTF